MHRLHSSRLLASLSIAALLATACANFPKLSEDLKFIDETVVISARVTNASSHKNIRGITADWDPTERKIKSADLAEPRCSTETGSEGYWRLAGYTKDIGLGIYFLEKYDPNRIPVIFVYGVAGSPQDWNTFFKKFDRKRYQLWFYQYPSAESLALTGGALNKAILLLQPHYQFNHLNIVARSMGRLVSRYATINNYKDGNCYIKHFTTISSPFGGMKFTDSGVKRAPSDIPS